MLETFREYLNRQPKNAVAVFTSQDQDYVGPLVIQRVSDGRFYTKAELAEFSDTPATASYWSTQIEDAKVLNDLISADKEARNLQISCVILKSEEVEDFCDDAQKITCVIMS